MRGEGFEIDAADVASSRGVSEALAEELDGLLPEEIADEYGYGLVETFDPTGVGPLAPILAAKPPRAADEAEYLFALVGRTVEELSGGAPSATDESCVGQAVSGVSPELFELRDRLIDFESEVNRLPAMMAAEAEWIECMSEQGYDANDWMWGRRQVAARLAALQATVEVVLLDGRVVPLASDPLLAFADDAELRFEQATLASIQEEELRIAAADFTCLQASEPTRSELRSAHLDSFYRANEDLVSQFDE